MKHGQRPRFMDELLRAVEADGQPGLIKAVARQIGPNQPSAECIAESDNCFQGALTEDDVWDCALDQASCLMEEVLEPEPPEPPEPEPPEPPPPPDPWGDIRLGTAVLAAMLVYLRHQSPPRPAPKGGPTTKH